MLNLDDDEIISAIESLLGRNSKSSFRKLLQYEFKPERYEARILCLVDYRVFIVLIKNNKPSKIESFIHLLDIKRIESSTPAQLIIQTNDNREFKFQSNEGSNSEDGSSGRLSISNQSTESVSSHSIIDEVISHILISLMSAFPNILIRDLIETVNILPDKRWQSLQNELAENKKIKRANNLDICGNYAQSYLIYCDLFGSNIYQEVVWDINFIYGQNGLKDFSLNDFDYALKDAVPLIAALRHNLWFESVNCDGIKLTNEMQEEIHRLFTMPSNKIRSLSLTHNNLKYDFLQRLYSSFQTCKARKTNGSSIKALNLSRNAIEDRGIVFLANLFKDFSYLSSLNSLHLSKCSLTSKGVNALFNAMSVEHSLNTLDLSFNSLKEEPIELLKYLSEPNQLCELNLANTDIDVDKLFMYLSKGGCEKNLKKLVLTGNSSFAKLGNLEHMKTFFGKLKSLIHLDLAHCKLNGNITLNLLNSIQLNASLPKSFHINLSSNDIGSYIRTLQNEFSYKSSITSVDLSDNGLDADTDLIINDMRNSNIKSLCLSKNFQNSKTKHVSKVIHSLIKWVTAKNSQLQSLWLVDCRLKSNLNDFVNELGTCTQLRFLDISGNDVGDFGVNLLSKSLQVNRSLHTLLFDRSNVSPLAYAHITDALKRNITLRSIQLPINDICASYQKSPERVIDAVKQMTELFSQRNLNLNAQHKFDLDQLFKTKMKSINDANSFYSSNVNASPSSTNSQTMLTNSSFSSSSSSSPTNNINGNKSINADAVEDTNDPNSSNPPSIKEILGVLNEAASSYLNEIPVEKQFAKLNEQYVDKLDGIASDLDRELNACLRKKYRKYTSSSSPSQSSSNKSFCSSIENGKLTAMLKANLKEYMNSMLIQIHNDICEITYNMSAAMAENLLNEANAYNQLNTPASKSVNNSASVSSKPTPQPETAKKDQEATQAEPVNQQSTSVKKPVGGVKMFPGLPVNLLSQPSTNSSSTASNGEARETGTKGSEVYHRIELMNNSKSKRPISTQMHQESNGQQNSESAANNSLILSSSPTHLTSSTTESSSAKPASVVNKNGRDVQSTKSSSSSSFENIKNTSDDDDVEASEASGKKSTSSEKIVENQTNDSDSTQTSVLNVIKPKSIAPVAPSAASLASSSSVNCATSSSSSSSLTTEDKSDARSRSKSPFETLTDTTLPNSARSLNQTTNSSSSGAKKENEPAEVSPPAPVPAPRKAKSLVKSIFGSFGGSSHSSSNDANSVTSPKASRKAVKEKETPAAPTPVQTPLPAATNESKSEPAPEDESRTLQHLNKNRAKRANVKRPTVKHPIVTIAEDDFMNDSTAPTSTHTNESSEVVSVANGVQHSTSNGETETIEVPSIAPSISISTSEPTSEVAKVPKSNSPTNSIVKPANAVDQPKISLNELGNVKLRKTIKVKNPDEPTPSSTNPVTPVLNSSQSTAKESTTLTSLATTPLAPSLAATVGGTASALSSLTSSITPTTTATVATTPAADKPSTNPATSNAGKLGNRFSMFEQPSMFSSLKPRNKELSTEPVSEEQQPSIEPIKNSISAEPNKLPSKTPPPIPPAKPPRPAFNPSLTPIGSNPVQSTPLFDKVKLRSVPGSATTSGSSNSATTPSTNSTTATPEVNKANSQKQQDLNDKRASVREIVQMLSVSEESKA